VGFNIPGGENLNETAKRDGASEVEDRHEKGGSVGRHGLYPECGSNGGKRGCYLGKLPVN